MIPGKATSLTARLLTPLLMATAACGEKGEAPEEKKVIATERVICKDQPKLVEQFQKLVKKELVKCITCHSPDGVAKEAWSINPETKDARDLQKGFDAFFGVAVKKDSKGGPLIVTYPAGQVSKDLPDGEKLKHGGGKQELTAAQIQALTEFHLNATQVSDAEKAPSLRVNDDCREAPRVVTEAEFFDGVEILSRSEIFIKFLTTIAGGPLPEDALNIQTDEQLQNALLQASQRLGFYDWLKWRFNDITNTRFYQNGGATGIMGKKFGVPWDLLDNKEVADNPGNLLVYIVSRDFSIRQLITADFYVIPGVKPKTEDPNENWVARIQAFGTQEASGEKLSGVITDPLFLAQHPTSDTNIGRHRAEFLLRVFGNVRIMDRPSPVAQAPAGIALETKTFPGCASCHNDLDKVAPAFWDYQKEEGYKHGNNLPADFFEISFDGVKIDKNDPDRLGKLLDAMAQSKGYDRAIADMVYAMVMNRAPMRKPVAGADEAVYEAQMRHWTVQEKFLNESAQFLRNNKDNLRLLIVRMVMSPWFAASGKTSEKLTDIRKVELTGVGPNMATPEVLAMRLRQLFGDDVTKTSIPKQVLTDYVTQLGGINSTTVRTRAKEPNASNELVRIYLSFEVDKLVMQGLLKPAAERDLFRDFNWEGEIEPPMYPVSHEPIYQNEEKYRAVLLRIQKRLGNYWSRKGDKLVPLTKDSPEITKELERFVKIWELTLKDLGNAKIASTHRVNGASADDKKGLYRAWGAYMADKLDSVDFGLYQ